MKVRRKKLVQEVKELHERLKAANGETRKGMRERLARVTGELEECRKQLRNAYYPGCAVQMEKEKS